MKTNQLIRALVADQATRPLPVALACAGALLFGLAVVAALVVIVLGLRPDIVSAIATVRVWFKFVVMLCLGLAGLRLLFRLARPGSTIGSALGTLAIAPLVLIAGVILELGTTTAASWGARLLGINWLVCLAGIALLALVPLGGLLAALRHAATTTPGLAGASAGLAAAALAATIFVAHCPDDSPLFVAVWYTLAIGLVVALGGLVGQRVLRW